LHDLTGAASAVDVAATPAVSLAALAALTGGLKEGTQDLDSGLAVHALAHSGRQRARSTLPHAQRARDGRLAARAATAFAEEPAERAPQGAREWTFGGVRVSAPVGQSFEQGVARDLDGDGALDVAAIVREIERPASAGTLVFYKGSPRGVAEPITPLKTGPLPEDAACTPTRRLAVVGRHSVLLELGAKCPSAPAHEPSRFIAVVAFAPQPRVHFSASVVDPPGAPSLLVEADGSDRDADGIDDVAVRVGVARPHGRLLRHLWWGVLWSLRRKLGGRCGADPSAGE
jgi:hypothetical protein